MYWIGLRTEVAVLNSQVVPISQVVLKTGFTVVLNKIFRTWLGSLSLLLFLHYFQQFALLVYQHISFFPVKKNILIAYHHIHNLLI